MPWRCSFVGTISRFFGWIFDILNPFTEYKGVQQEHGAFVEIIREGDNLKAPVDGVLQEGDVHSRIRWIERGMQQLKTIMIKDFSVSYCLMQDLLRFDKQLYRTIQRYQQELQRADQRLQKIGSEAGRCFSSVRAKTNPAKSQRTVKRLQEIQEESERLARQMADFTEKINAIEHQRGVVQHYARLHYRMIEEWYKTFKAFSREFKNQYVFAEITFRSNELLHLKLKRTGIRAAHNMSLIHDLYAALQRDNKDIKGKRAGGIRKDLAQAVAQTQRDLDQIHYYVVQLWHRFEGKFREIGTVINAAPGDPEAKARFLEHQGASMTSLRDTLFVQAKRLRNEFRLQFPQPRTIKLQGLQRLSDEWKRGGKALTVIQGKKGVPEKAKPVSKESPKEIPRQRAA